MPKSPSLKKAVRTRADLNGARNRLTAFDAVYAYGKNGGTIRKTVTNPLAFTMAFN
jgi:hypothetical protein